MKPDNYMTLSFLGLSSNEAFARAAVGAFIAPLDPTMEELSDIKTAVSEAVTNAIVHGYPESTGNIVLECTVYPQRVIEIKITDNGVGIQDIKKARMPLFTTGGEERSGMGFTIMERFMSSLTVTSEPGNGTAVIMTRNLQKGVYH